MGATGLLKVKNRGLIVTESVPTADSDLTALPICWDWAATFDALQAQSTTARVSLSQVVVLVPFAQVMWAAKRAWLASRGDGPMPRFVTTIEWARSYGGADTTGHDVLMSPGLDQATALSLLEQLDLPRLEPHWLDHLAQQVVVAVHSLASVSAAQPPGRRSEWAADLLLQLNADGGGVARLDAVVKQLAVVWAGQSSWETDVLWDASVLDDSPLLCHIPGWSSDPLAQALLAHWAGQKMTGVLPTPVHQRTQIRTQWLPCADGQDEALEAAAAVIRHVNDSTRQVGLVALDRGMVRRIVRMLELQGVSVRDETGWRLSTSRIAARILAVLQAGLSQATAGDWVDAALQVNPNLTPAERLALSRWQDRSRWHPVWNGDVPGPLQKIRAALDNLSAARSWVKWGEAISGALRELGVWAEVEADPVGTQLIDTWGWHGRTAVNLPRRWQRMPLSAYLNWMRSAAEGASFRPEAHTQAAVTVVPLAQLAYREFDALVMCGCDAQSMPPAPKLPGPWTGAQRLALGLADLSDAAEQFSVAWSGALHMADATVCWRMQAGQETLGPSVWVLRAQAEMNPVGAAIGAFASQEGAPCERMSVQHHPVYPTAPGLTQEEMQLLPSTVSATRYQRLRDCPYRFFVRDILGLADPQETDDGASAKDFGSWIHKILQRFHSDPSVKDVNDHQDLQDRLDACARLAETDLDLGHSSMLVYWASWPPVRDGYAQWWMDWARQGTRVRDTEAQVSLALDEGLEMRGDIDRMDTLQSEDGLIGWVLDYKTESIEKTKRKIKTGLEDTQLAFYVTLAKEWGRINGADAQWRAGYVNVGYHPNRPGQAGTQYVEQTDADALGQRITEQVINDWRQMRDGKALRPLGEVPVCDYCSARGLCRRDHWEAQS